MLKDLQWLLNDCWFSLCAFAVVQAITDPEEAKWLRSKRKNWYRWEWGVKG